MLEKFKDSAFRYQSLIDALATVSRPVSQLPLLGWGERLRGSCEVVGGFKVVKIHESHEISSPHSGEHKHISQHP